MRQPWIRHPPGPEENRQAAGIALAVAGAIGAVIFYLARLFLARERIRPPGELSAEAAPEGWPRKRVGEARRKSLEAGPADDPTVEG